MVESPLTEAPSEGILVVYGASSIWDYLAVAPDRKRAAKRIFLVDVSRQYLPHALEDDELAGAIEGSRV